MVCGWTNGPIAICRAATSSNPIWGTGDALPVDYKIYVFGGAATHCQVHERRGPAHRWTLFDSKWRPVSSGPRDTPAPPRHLDSMLAAAATLARPFDFARVDFYEVADTPLFGEISFYPGSGLDPFDPVGLDVTLGTLWPRAGGLEQLPWRGRAMLSPRARTTRHGAGATWEKTA